MHVGWREERHEVRAVVLHSSTYRKQDVVDRAGARWSVCYTSKLSYYAWFLWLCSFSLLLPQWRGPVIQVWLITGRSLPFKVWIFCSIVIFTQRVQYLPSKCTLLTFCWITASCTTQNHSESLSRPAFSVLTWLVRPSLWKTCLTCPFYHTFPQNICLSSYA